MDEEAGPCPWVYDDVRDFKSWYARYVRRQKIPEDMDRGTFLRHVNNVRVTFFGQRILRNNEVKVFKVDPTVGQCEHLHHIVLSGRNKDILGSMTDTMGAMLATSFQTGDEWYHNIFHGENPRPMAFVPIKAPFRKVWNHTELVQDTDSEAIKRYVFREDFYNIAKYEARFNTNVWVCDYRNVVVIVSDDMSSMLRTKLRLRTFVDDMTKEMDKATKKTKQQDKKKKTKKEKTKKESTHFFDWNNPYTILSKLGFGEKYM